MDLALETSCDSILQQYGKKPTAPGNLVSALPPLNPPCSERGSLPEEEARPHRGPQMAGSTRAHRERPQGGP